MAKRKRLKWLNVIGGQAKRCRDVFRKALPAPMFTFWAIYLAFALAQRLRLFAFARESRTGITRWNGRKFPRGYDVY